MEISSKVIAPHTSKPALRNNLSAAISVPPVARTSSISKTLAFLGRVDWAISKESEPYSSP